MVAVKNHEADRFVSQPPDSVSVFLVFGSDAGLVSERSGKLLDQAVADRHDPFQMVAMAGDDVADDPGKLIDEARTIGLFEARRAIHITAGRKSFVEPIKALISEPPGDCTIVISAGAMRGDAPLRSACARAKAAAAIECYPDQDRDIGRLIDDEVRHADLAITSQGRAALVAALGADRLTTRAEISKLVLYTHGQKEITEDDVYAIVTDAAGHAYDDAVDAAFLGKRSEATETYADVAAGGGNLNLFCNVVLRRCLLLHRMLLELEAGQSRDSVLQKYGQSKIPPVRKTMLIAQLNSWNSRQIKAVIERIEEMFFRIRADAAMAPVVAARVLWLIATSMPGQRSRSGS